MSTQDALPAQGGNRSIGVQGAKGAVAGLLGQLGKLAINMLSLVVLARLLAPGDFGLIAMVVALVGVADLLRDMGLSTAAIRAPSLSRQQRSNLWWVNTGIGAACTAVILALSPLIAWFYNEPRLVSLTAALSVMYLLGGMTTQYSADLVRRMRFGHQAVASLASAAIAFAVALYGALSGWGHWALAVQQVLGAGIFLALSAIMAGWLPRRYQRAVPMREFFQFGFPLFGSQVLTYASGNLDMILVGRSFGSSSLGFYSRGMQLVRMPINQVRSPLNNAALSTLSKVKPDRAKYANYVAKAQLIMLYPIAILTTFIAATAPDIVPFILGPGWTPVAAFVTIFAVGDMISSLAAAGGWLYLAEGKSAALLRYTVFSSLLRISFFIIALPFGIHAVASVYCIAPVILWPISLWYCNRATGHATLPLFISSLRVFLSTGAAFSLAYGTGSWLGEPGLHRFGITVASYLLALLLCAIFPKFRADITEVTHTAKAVLKR